MFTYLTKEYDENEDIIKSIVAMEGSNNVYNVTSHDIDSSSTTSLKLTYQKENEREKTLRISAEADYIYNGALYKYYTKDDLTLDDCFYTLIDNTSDGKIDVIIAEKYETFMTDIVIMNENKIIDNKSNVYDLTDYFEEGGKIYNTDGDSITLDDFGAFSIISYLKSKDNKYTKFIVSQNTEEGIFNEMQSDYRYVYVSGEKYETLTRYHKNRNEYDLVNLGDEVKLFFDFAGFVADIKRISGVVKAGYIIDNISEDAKRPKIRLLKEDGSIGKVEFASSVVLDNVKRKASSLSGCESLFKNGEVIPQLILYKDNSNGKIFYLDTATDNSGIGKTSDDASFSLDYDYEKESTLRIITTNGKKVLGSKYLPDSDTKLFCVSTKIDECYVQTGNALGTGTSYKIKLYNVGEDYVPAYATIEAAPKLGEWVDWYNTTYVVENVTKVYDSATDDNYYKLIFYDGKGNINSSLIRDGDLKTPGGNVFSGDERLRKITAKDLVKGTVLQIKEDKYGISSISVQSVPMADNSEKLFEKSNSSTSYDYGITEYLFNGATMCAYGKVVKRVPGGIVVNNHIPTSAEVADGGVFPMESWNRMYPFTSSDNVWFYDKSTDELKFAPATEILEGDMIFIHRKAGTVTTAIIYR
ncbi:MAG: hypothetical protein E7404_09055 [Ruminococcaceae bacterium]|nr:hypothetical protein [Oscillospiraceae bacterium]